MKPYDYVLAGRYEEALAAYDASTEARDVSFFANRATALLCLGRFNEALADYEKASALENARPVKGIDAFLECIGAVHWLLGDGEAAITILSEVASRIRSGKKAYTDFSGGAAPGLMLWAAGHCFERPDAVERAVTYLEWVAKRRWIKHWPGPIAICVIGKTDLPTVILTQFGQSDLIRYSKQELGTLERRELVQALFYAAFLTKLDGERVLAKQYIEACAYVINPLIEEEWYLSRCASVLKYFAT